MNYDLMELKELFYKRCATTEVLVKAIEDIREEMQTLETAEFITGRYYMICNISLTLTNKDYFNELVEIGNTLLRVKRDAKSHMETYFGLHLLYSCIGFMPKVVEYALKILSGEFKDIEVMYSVYSSLAITCKEIGMIDRAIEYTLAPCGGKNYEDESLPLKVRFITANNIAMIYLDNGCYEKALECKAFMEQIMRDYPEDPDISPLYPLVQFSFLLIEVSGRENTAAIEKYVAIMQEAMQNNRERIIARQTLEPHLVFLKKLLEAGQVKEVLEIARFIRENPSRFYGNMTDLYQIMIEGYRQNGLTGEDYHELVSVYIQALEQYKTQNEAVLKLLIKEQYRINEIDNKYNDIRKKLEDDTLTHCHNRQSLEMNGKAYMENYVAGSLVFFDLDNLKITNDRYGHSAGDNLLVDFVRCVNMVKPENADFFRYAGDEFILLTPIDSNEAESLVSRIEEQCRIVSQTTEQYAIEFSYGIANFAENPEQMAEVIRVADRRMYECKEKHHARRK